VTSDYDCLGTKGTGLAEIAGPDQTNVYKVDGGLWSIYFYIGKLRESNFIRKPRGDGPTQSSGNRGRGQRRRRRRMR